jgi:hypothetical protein
MFNDFKVKRPSLQTAMIRLKNSTLTPINLAAILNQSFKTQKMGKERRRKD